MKYYVEGYGCAFNMAETEQIKGLFEENRFSRADSPEDAEILLVNTCAVKDRTEERMLHRLRVLARQKKGSGKLIAFGCLAATRKEPIRRISEEIITLGTDLESLCERLGVEVRSFSPERDRVGDRDTVAVIPIATGCRGSCAYCATRLARGKLKSYSIESIGAAFRKAAASPCEIWLTSQDLACYGMDSHSSLSELMGVLLETEGDYFVRLGMMNPNHFLAQHEEILAIYGDPRVFKFIHLPVQSGSDGILERMGRGYTAAKFLECISLARAAHPDITIATDVIAGCPGETEEDFAASLRVLEEIQPDVVNIARYSRRPGTKAAEMEDQVDDVEKKARSKRLTEFRNGIFLSRNRAMVGQRSRAFVSEKKPDGKFVARTSNYRPVIVDSHYGEFVDVELTRSATHCFVGKIL